MCGLFLENLVALIYESVLSLDFPGGSDGRASAYNVGDPGSTPGSGRSGEENGNPLQYLAYKIHGWRSLVGYSPWGCKDPMVMKFFHYHTVLIIMNTQ